jgi:hypothetical protein
VVKSLAFLGPGGMEAMEFLTLSDGFWFGNGPWRIFLGTKKRRITSQFFFG